MSGTLLRGARAITMSPERPDAERIDIPIDGDRIADTGERLDSSKASSHTENHDGFWWSTRRQQAFCGRRERLSDGSRHREAMRVAAEDAAAWVAP